MNIILPYRDGKGQLEVEANKLPTDCVAVTYAGDCWLRGDSGRWDQADECVAGATVLESLEDLRETGNDESPDDECGP